MTLAACAGSTSEDGTPEQSEPLPGEAAIGLGRGETLPSFSPRATAEANWGRGEAAFKKEDFLLAQRYYIYIRRNFPYSKFAAESDVRIADCQFERKRYREAIDGYQNYVRLHPNHPKVPYALFQIGRANYELIPNELFIFPPAYEKDQTEVRETAVALAAFVRRYPEHEKVQEARELLKEVRARLLAHERYVADFYERRGRIKGYVGRLERIRTRFPDVGLTPALLSEIVRAYVRLKDRASAERTLAELEEKFPDASDELKEARRALSSLPEPPPPPPVEAEDEEVVEEEGTESPPETDEEE